jgi:RIO-like serine/threonine protein kinase
MTDWTTDLVEANTVSHLGKQGAFRPLVRLVKRGEETFVAKDYRACVAPYRWTVGAWNLKRESQALAKLAGIDGVPALVARVGRWVLVMEHFKGRDIGKTRKAAQTPELFDALARLVAEMHARGVVHLDLRQRRNILVRPGKRPAIVDFGGALCLRPGSRLHRRLAAIDRSGVLKYKRRALPASITDEEARLLRNVERGRSLWPFS